MSNKLKKEWRVREEISADFIKNNSDINPIVLQLLRNRGIMEKTEIDDFLTKDCDKNIFDPFAFAQMSEAVDLIIKHIKEQNKITIYGDYDADGATSSALLCEVLKTLRAHVDVYIPDRASEGYGMNRSAIDEISSSGIRLIITVDLGIRDKELVKYAGEKGIDVVITDHHVGPEEDSGLPDCLIINPALKKETYPFKFLAGVGVAFKLAQALIRKSKLADEDKRKIEERSLDLVAIGTVADLVILKGENRALVTMGMGILNRTKRTGLIELIKAAKINNGKILDSWNIGFQIAPRLNAAGRMEHANTAVELLVIKDKNEAEVLARHLNDKNIERQNETSRIVEDALSMIGSKPVGDIIIAISPRENPWNEGLIGLVAGRITEKYYRPCLVITYGEKDMKGSGRSIEEFNIIEAISACAEYLEKFGGHPAACGFSVGEDNLGKFVERISRLAHRKLSGLALSPKLEIDAELNLAKINESLIEEIERLAPFGRGNEKPRFVSRGVQIVDIFTMGIDGQHIKFKIKDENSSAINAIGFGRAEEWEDLRIGDKIDIVYYIEMNEFNGRKEAQMKIVDISHDA